MAEAGMDPAPVASAKNGSVATSVEPVPADIIATAAAVIGFSGGAISVYATPDADGSHVVAQALDADGKPNAKARLLRRTSGEVQSIALALDGDKLWVAWGSQMLSEDKHLAAFVTTDKSLARVSAPVTLVHETLDGGEPNHWIRSTVIPGGAMFATRAMGQRVPCLHHPEANATCHAPGYKVFTVQVGEPKLVKHGAIDGNPLELASMIVVKDAVSVRAWAYHGGPEYDQAWISLTDAGAPPIPLATARPPFDQAWTGTELVTLSGEITEACADGHPIIKGKPIVDPTKPGAVVPRMSGWTGKVLLSIPEGGALPLMRRVCKGNALEPAP